MLAGCAKICLLSCCPKGAGALSHHGTRCLSAAPESQGIFKVRPGPFSEAKRLLFVFCAPIKYLMGEVRSGRRAWLRSCLTCSVVCLAGNEAHCIQQEKPRLH